MKILPSQPHEALERYLNEELEALSDRLKGEQTQRAESAEELTREIGKTAKIQEIGKAPFVLMINKADLADDWQIDAAAISALRSDGWTVFETSAKSGRGVEHAFHSLAKTLLEG